MKLKVAEQIGSHEDPATIEDLLLFMCGQRPSLRNPNRCHSVLTDPTANKWHQDGDWETSGGKHRFIGPYAIVIWSNRESSEIRDDATYEILTFPPGAIVLVRNRFCHHRIPREISPDRWFARVWDVKIRRLQRLPVLSPEKEGL